MASVQCHKPSEQTNNQVQSSTYHQKATTTEKRHNKNHNTNTNEHSFTDKVKEMAHSARKMFNHQEHEGHEQKPTSNCSSGTAHCGVKTEKKKKKMMVKKTEGHEGHCMPKMLDHVKNMKKKVKKNKEEKHSGSSSDSGSSSESDNETTKRKN